MADSTLLASLTNCRFQEESCSSDTLSSYRLTRGLWAGKTPYSQVVVAESPVYGKVLFLDKELQSAESDERIYHEHLVHPAMNALAHRLQKRVLIVGGGEGATAREVLRYDAEQVSEVVWIDIDGLLVNVCREHLCWANDSVYNDSRLTFQARDIREFLQSNPRVFDLIILDLPDPDVEDLQGPPSQPFALYSEQFWDLLALNLAPRGAVVTHAGPVSPGANGLACRPGLAWIQSMASKALGCNGAPYRVTIPSFQSEWGFWMSIQPSKDDHFPPNLAVMDMATQKQAFTWPKYWFSPLVGTRYTQ